MHIMYVPFNLEDTYMYMHVHVLDKKIFTFGVLPVALLQLCSAAQVHGQSSQNGPRDETSVGQSVD
jgi:hypothetical protein